MRKNIIFIAVLTCFLTSGCQVIEKQRQVGAVVEIKGHYLHRFTLDSLTVGLSREDSARVAQQYIDQWAKDILVYENAKGHSSPQLESLVEDYRQMLYVQAYEEYLIDTRMSKTIPDSVAEQIYQAMPDRFKLSESIIKGILVVVPNDAPNIAKLRQWMNQENLDEIEKYAYQNANGYELFDDKWLTTTDIIRRIPIDRKEFENRLRNKNQIETSDTIRTYLLQVTDKHLSGGQMPVEYARPEIEKIVLSGRQVDFLQQERVRLYEEAKQTGEIIFYEN